MSEEAGAVVLRENAAERVTIRAGMDRSDYQTALAIRLERLEVLAEQLGEQLAKATCDHEVQTLTLPAWVQSLGFAVDELAQESESLARHLDTLRD
jgi:hypothetical protein